MSARQLRAIRVYFNRTPDGDFRFVTGCLNGVRGDDAKTAAEGAITSAVEQGYVEDDQRIADDIIALVEIDEGVR